MKRGTEVRLDPIHIALNWDPAPPKKGVQSLPISARVCCGQMAGCTKIPHGMEVGLGPGDFVLDGDPAVPKRGTSPNFRPMSIVAKRLDGSRCHLIQR